jgi:hypothetical protein
MTHSELLTVARQLAESLADIKASFGGALNGSPASIARIRDALMVARSAVDGTDLGPLTYEEESDPREWGRWAESHRFGLAEADELPDDSMILIG